MFFCGECGIVQLTKKRGAGEGGVYADHGHRLSIKSIDNEALHEEELEKIVVSANELTVHSVEKNCNNIVFVAIRMVI